MGLEIYAGDDLGPSLISKIKLSRCLKGLVQFEKEQGCARKKKHNKYTRSAPSLSFNSHMYVLFLLYTMCRQGTASPLFAFTSLTQAICGDRSEEEWKDTQSRPQTGGYISPSYMNESPLLLLNPWEREGDRESWSTEEKKRSRVKSVFFFSPKIFQCYFNAAAAGGLAQQAEREREVETETLTERWLRDERTEGSREAETKWESRKEREPKRLHCCSTVESQRQLSHMSANRDGEWVKGIVGLFIDIKTTRFDCAETGEQSENRYRIKTFWEIASVPSQMAKILLFVLFFSTVPEVITDWSDHSVRQPERERGRKRAWQTETRVYLLKQPFTAFQTRILR